MTWYEETIDDVHRASYSRFENGWGLTVLCSPKGLAVDHAPTLAAARNKARDLVSELLSYDHDEEEIDLT